MSERRPIDELFARALRNAEATPPDRVWEGVVRDRGWAHLTLLRLQRRWGMLAVLLLLGGASAYWGMGGMNAERNTRSADRAALKSVTTQPDISIAPAEASEPSTKVAEARPSVPASPPASTLDPKSGHGASATATMPVVAVSQRSVQPAKPALEVHAVPERKPVTHRINGPGTTAHLANEPDVLAIDHTPAAKAIPTSMHHPDPGQQHDVDLGTGIPTTEQGPAPGNTTTATTFEWASSRAKASGDARFLRVRLPEFDRTPASAAPDMRPAPGSAPPRRTWWVAATAAQFRESRTWHGPDAPLVQGLQSTEVPHYPVGFGVLFGMGTRGGWGVATGLEYNAERYNYRHLDRFIQRNDSLVPFVITFNDQVLESFSDTLTTYDEEHRNVATENQYTTLRIPVEGSWHRAWHRWHFGVRTGLALEFNTQRAGSTLVESEGGAHSVDVNTAAGKRSTTLITGSMAADLGFGLTERLGLWASPTFAVGLLPLASGNDVPYAMPERFGVRLRLAYTLRPDR